MFSFGFMLKVIGVMGCVILPGNVLLILLAVVPVKEALRKKGYIWEISHTPSHYLGTLHRFFLLISRPGRNQGLLHKYLRQ